MAGLVTPKSDFGHRQDTPVSFGRALSVAQSLILDQGIVKDPKSVFGLDRQGLTENPKSITHKNILHNPGFVSGLQVACLTTTRTKPRVSPGWRLLSWRVLF